MRWATLVDDTAEHAPGAWRLDAPEAGKVACHPLGLVIRAGTWEPVAAVLPTDGGYVNGSDAGAAYVDHMRDANARLIADAPHLLKLLARAADCMGMVLAPGRRGDAPTSRLQRELAATLARHVTVGPVGVDPPAGYVQLTLLDADPGADGGPK